MFALNQKANPVLLYIGWTTLVLLTLVGALIWDNPIYLFIPIGFFGIWWVSIDYRNIYYLFFIVVPFSVEYNFTATLGTDLPSEPIMWIMFGVSILLFLSKYASHSFRKYSNIITYLLLLHLAWIGIATIMSESLAISFKVFLAKLWYIIPFYFLSIHILRTEKELRKTFTYSIIFLSISIAIVIYRHFTLGFKFDEVNKAVSILFRNHVNYACIIVILIPYLWALIKLEKNSLFKILFWIMNLLFVLGIYFSYTRAAIIALLMTFPIYLVIHFRYLKSVMIGTGIFLLIGIVGLISNNKYMDLVPDYEKTITHKEFDNLLSATSKGEDISTMERVYRWVAGMQMIKDKPFFGFGPGSFFSHYKAYTIASFQTYVSRNEEHSTVHNYFLLTCIEQGIFGLIIFLSLCIAVLLVGYKTYHNLSNPSDKAFLMASLLSFCIIILLNLINDMIETDKVGPFFFLSMAIITKYSFTISNQKLNTNT